MAYTQEFTHHYIPARYRTSGAKQKLMIVLHGRGDSIRPFRYFDEEMQIPNMNYLLINAPRKYLTGYTWYGFPPNQESGVLKARQKLFVLMDELKAQGWKSKDIFLFGFSQGSLVSCDFAMNYSEPLGGVIGVSGYLYLFPQWKEKVSTGAFQTPWLITHGTEDVDLPIDTTREQVQELLDIGLPIEWLELPKDHVIDEKREIPCIRQWIRAVR